MRLPRLRPTLGLRALMLVVLGCGLWLGRQANMARDQARAISGVERLGGYVHFDYEFADGRWIAEPGPRGAAWLRRHLGEDLFRGVTSVTYLDQPIGDARLAALVGLGGFEELRFVYLPDHYPIEQTHPPPGPAPPTESGLSHLRNLPHLRRLEIECSRLSGSMLRNLSGSPLLEELRLIDTGITDEGMPPLAVMPNLRMLSLRRNPIRGQCLGPLRWSPSLETLWLHDCPISPSGMENIGAIASLKDLSLGPCSIDDMCMSHISGLARLERLDLNTCKVSARGFEALRGLRQLRRLDVSWTDFDDEGLRAIAGSTHLERLNLSQTKVTDAGLIHLKGMGGLKELSLYNTRTTRAAVDGLKAAIPSLIDAP